MKKLFLSFISFFKKKPTTVDKFSKINQFLDYYDSSQEEALKKMIQEHPFEENEIVITYIFRYFCIQQDLNSIKMVFQLIQSKDFTKYGPYIIRQLFFVMLLFNFSFLKFFLDNNVFLQYAIHKKFKFLINLDEVSKFLLENKDSSYQQFVLDYLTSIDKRKFQLI
jgi:hypothetical protein